MKLTKTTEKQYNDMLEVLPPEAMTNGRFSDGDIFSCFLVGEPVTHKNGVPVYASYFTSNDIYYRGEAMTATELYNIAREPDRLAEYINQADEPAEGSDDARILEAIDEHGNDIVKAYAYLVGWDYVEADKISDEYVGEYDSDEAFAQQMAEDSGQIADDAQWPYTCIDWERASRDLMYDYHEHDGFYFRNC
jgi:hypothetical protein